MANPLTSPNASPVAGSYSASHQSHPLTQEKQWT